jgi:hypothetical protein
LFHGDSLQGIDTLERCDEQGLLLNCQVPKVARKKKGEFALNQSNIFANDLVYQAMLVWVREQKGLGSLPSSTLKWSVYREAKVGEKFSLNLDVKEASDSKLVADIQLIDANSKLLAEIESAEVTASESLNDLFKQTS